MLGEVAGEASSRLVVQERSMLHSEAGIHN